jgi:hypothetical protein
MLHGIQQLWNFHIWTLMSAISALTALISIVADRLRQKRKVMEAVGFMPWTGISVMAILATIVSLALAIKAG